MRTTYVQATLGPYLQRAALSVVIATTLEMLYQMYAFVGFHITSIVEVIKHMHSKT